MLKKIPKPEISPLFKAVYPKRGLLRRCLDALDNPRKHRWNAYVRACKAIPMSSPIYGTTSWKKINTRRGELIDKRFQKDGGRSELEEIEFRALQKIAGQIGAPSLVPTNWLLGRIARRARSKANKRRITQASSDPKYK